MANAIIQMLSDRDASLEDDEIELGVPDIAEAHSLPLHVEKCAKRYRVTIRRLNKLDRSSSTIKWLLALIFGAVALTGAPNLFKLAGLL